VYYHDICCCDGYRVRGSAFAAGVVFLAGGAALVVARIDIDGEWCSNACPTMPICLSCAQHDATAMYPVLVGFIVYPCVSIGRQMCCGLRFRYHCCCIADQPLV
jgi:hypothetical protein